MRAELQRHLVKTNIYIRVVIHFLRSLGNLADKINALWESFKLECPKNGLRALRPLWYGLEVQLDFFGM